MKERGMLPWEEAWAAMTNMVHTIDPVYNEDSEILILGSFPSVKSREQQFFYGHKQNRFWKVLAQVLECKVPEDIPQKGSDKHFGIILERLRLVDYATD